jgi:deoxyribonuclease-4
VALGADFLVVHPVSRGENAPEQAVANVIDSVKQACKRIQMRGLRVLIENTAGMGSSVGWRLEEVAQIVAALRDLNVGACLDTAHLFAAGYDIKSEGGLEATITQIEQTIGLENVPVFHINDSKIPLGGRVDRHDHLSHGKIGRAAFERILKHPKLGAALPQGMPGRVFLLETPIDEPGDDRRNVAKLWELAGLKEQAPEAEKGFSMLTAAIKKKMAAQNAFEKKTRLAAEKILKEKKARRKG